MGVHLLKKQHSAGGSYSSSSGGSWSSSSSSSSGHHHQQQQMPPKGCVAVRVVGPGGAAEEARFVVPVGHLKHPLFEPLLKAAEDEYGFEHKGAITIPCGVDHFRRVQGIIHHQKHHSNASSSSFAAGGGHSQSNHFHIAGCFRA